MVWAAGTLRCEIQAAVLQRLRRRGVDGRHPRGVPRSEPHRELRTAGSDQGLQRSHAVTSWAGVYTRTCDAWRDRRTVPTPDDRAFTPEPRRESFACPRTAAEIGEKAGWPVYVETPVIG